MRCVLQIETHIKLFVTCKCDACWTGTSNFEYVPYEWKDDIEVPLPMMEVPS